LVNAVNVAGATFFALQAVLRRKGLILPQISISVRDVGYVLGYVRETQLKLYGKKNNGRNKSKGKG
jgi:hypothetical protein